MIKQEEEVRPSQWAPRSTHLQVVRMAAVGKGTLSKSKAKRKPQN